MTAKVGKTCAHHFPYINLYEKSVIAFSLGIGLPFFLLTSNLHPSIQIAWQQKSKWSFQHIWRPTKKKKKKKKKKTLSSKTFKWSTCNSITLTQPVLCCILGWMLRMFTQSWKETKGLIISLCWYGSKDHHFILLPGHILYRKSGGHKIVCSICTGVKFKSCLSRTTPTDFSCYNDSEKV